MAELMTTLPVEENENKDQICALCLTQFARYVCPKCNVRYCSLGCYKSEKHYQCSEVFYRDSIISELQQRQTSHEDKEKVVEILQRLEEYEPPQAEISEAEASLEERLANLDLEKDSEEVWQKLTSSEKEEFQKMVDTGALSHLLSSYTPWWEIADRLVIPLDEEETIISSLPPLPTSLPPLHTLIKDGLVSPCVPYNLVNMLYAYAYTVRLYNGEHYQLPLQASQTIFDISGSLASNSFFETAESALQAAMAKVLQDKNIFNSVSFSAAVLKDVECILSSRKSHDCHMLRALSDLHKLFGLARSSIKGASPDETNRRGSDHVVKVKCSSRELWLARKKIHFYMAWASSVENITCCARLSQMVRLQHGMPNFPTTVKPPIKDTVGDPSFHSL